MSYINTFIQIADDCPITSSVIPTAKGKHTPIHVIQYELLSQQPYHYTHEELIFAVHVRRHSIEDDEQQARKAEIWAALFQKGHPCLRASELTKKYGWGAHYNEEGKIAIYGVESEEYKQFVQGTNGVTQVLMAMRSKRR